MSELQLDPLIRSAEAGDADARRQLFATLYDELRRIAQRELRRSGAELTLSATTLLHEAYLNITGRDGVTFPDRARFMAYASRAMRGLVIDYARSRQAQKRGGGFEITSLPTQLADVAVDHGELERVSESLDELALIDPALAGIVDVKFFCGLSFSDIAAMRGVCERTVQRDWEKAHHSLRESDNLPP